MRRWSAIVAPTMITPPSGSDHRTAMQPRRMSVRRSGATKPRACAWTALNDVRVRPALAWSNRLPTTSVHAVPHTKNA